MSRDLDIKVAEKVMGWKRMSWKDYHDQERASGHFNGTDERDDLTYSWHNAEGKMIARAEDSDDYYQPSEAWSPSTSIEAAWDVVDAMRLKGFAFRVCSSEYEEGCGEAGEICADFSPMNGGHVFSAFASTAPEAICKAASAAILKVVEGT